MSTGKFPNSARDGPGSARQHRIRGEKEVFSMNQPSCQRARDQEARQRAAAILAQSQPMEPAMKRYAHPIPCWSAPAWSPPSVGGEGMDRVLEELARQNQLLMDLLGAVNSLTAATLSIRSRFVGEA